MNKCNKKFPIIMLAFVATLIYLVTINSNNYDNSNIVAVSPQLVLAEREGEGEIVTQEECANIIDKVKGFDEKDISRLLADDNSGQKFQDLRVSIIMCGALSDLDNALKPDDLQRLDSTVIAILGSDIIQNLIR